MTRKEEIEKLVETSAPVFEETSDKIWGYAELCYEETQSSALQKKVLRELGFSIQEVKNMPTAFIASYGEGHPIVAILGEYDALSNLNQEADCDVHKPMEAGKPGHGCGHNLLGTASMCAVNAVKNYLQAHNLPGTIRYYGCPAEEGGSAKTFMVRDGLFKDCDIELSWHPAQFNYGWDGKDCLGTYNILFKFKGIAAHAAACPQLGRSALDACELMNVGVNYLREHIIPEARVHYAYLNAGGTAPNVVPAEAELSYVIRAPKMSDMYDIADRVIDCAKGAALMTSTQMSYKVVSGTSNLISTKIVRDRFDANIDAFLPIPYTEEELAYAEKFKKTLDSSDEKRLIDSIQRNYPDKTPAEVRAMYEQPMANWYCHEYGNSASTDAGDVSWVVPGCQLHIACYPAGTPFHSWQMVAMGKSSLAKKGLKTAAKVLAMTALDFMLDPAMIEQARKDYKDALQGETYRCPLPDDLMPGDKSF